MCPGPDPDPDPGIDHGVSRRAAEQAAKRFRVADPLVPAITKEGLYAVSGFTLIHLEFKSMNLHIVA